MQAKYPWTIFFRKLCILPLSEGDTNASPSIPLDKQLVTAHLKDILINQMSPGETHEPPSIVGETHEPPTTINHAHIGETLEPPAMQLPNSLSDHSIYPPSTNPSNDHVQIHSIPITQSQTVESLALPPSKRQCTNKHKTSTN